MNDEGASLSLGFLDLFHEACSARILGRKQPKKGRFFREYADLCLRLD